MFTAMPFSFAARMSWRATVMTMFVLIALAAPRPGAAQQGCAPSNRGMAQMQLAEISLLNAAQQRIALRAFIADEPLEMASGYQHICPEVVARTAILFRYPAPVAGRFHMHNVKAPLDIGFFDQSGLLFQAMQMHPYQDGDEILYGPMQKFQYALEARLGFFGEQNLAAGASRLLLDTLP